MGSIRQISVTLPPALRAHCEDVARKADRPLSAQIRHVLQRVADAVARDPQPEQGER